MREETPEMVEVKCPGCGQNMGWPHHKPGPEDTCLDCRTSDVQREQEAVIEAAARLSRALRRLTEIQEG